MKSILVATDFSACAEAAVAQAAEIARATGAELTVLHVDELPAGTLAFPGALALVGTQMWQAVAAEAETRLHTARKRLESAGIRVHTMHVRGVPYLEIARAADGFDLVVVGRHGRIHALMGTVAERVLRMAACPVLTVPAAPA